MPYTNPYAQEFTPTSGSTVTIKPFDGPLLSVLLNPSGLLAVLNIVLPTAANGQQIVVCSTQPITLINMTASVNLDGVAVSIVLPLTGILTGGGATYGYFKSINKYMKVG